MPVTVLSGSIVRLWDVLESVLARHEHRLNRLDRVMRIVRVDLCGAAPERDYMLSGDAVIGDAGASRRANADTSVRQTNADAPLNNASAHGADPAHHALAPIIGVRYPAFLLDEVVATLTTQHQFAAGKLGGAGIQAGAATRHDDVDAVVPALFMRAYRCGV